jgi:hypothetical protein
MKKAILSIIILSALLMACSKEEKQSTFSKEEKQPTFSGCVVKLVYTQGYDFQRVFNHNEKGELIESALSGTESYYLKYEKDKITGYDWSSENEIFLSNGKWVRSVVKRSYNEDTVLSDYFTTVPTYCGDLVTQITTIRDRKILVNNINKATQDTTSTIKLTYNDSGNPIRMTNKISDFTEIYTYEYTDTLYTAKTNNIVNMWIFPYFQDIDDGFYVLIMSEKFRPFKIVPSQIKEETAEGVRLFKLHGIQTDANNNISRLIMNRSRRIINESDNFVVGDPDTISFEYECR